MGCPGFMELIMGMVNTQIAPKISTLTQRIQIHKSAEAAKDAGGHRGVEDLW